MTEQQNHLSQFVEQRNKLSTELENLGSQTTRVRDLMLKTQGAIEYLNAIGVTLPESQETVENEDPTEKSSEQG